MEPFQDRVVLEHGALREKSTKLYDFIHSMDFLKLNNQDKASLRKQLEAMGTYTDILMDRISLFGP